MRKGRTPEKNGRNTQGIIIIKKENDIWNKVYEQGRWMEQKRKIRKGLKSKKEERGEKIWIMLKSKKDDRNRKEKVIKGLEDRKLKRGLGWGCGGEKEDMSNGWREGRGGRGRHVTKGCFEQRRINNGIGGDERNETSQTKRKKHKELE